MSQKPRRHRVSLVLAAILVIGTGYLGLSLHFRTPAPFLLVHGSSMEPTLHAGDILMSRRVPANRIEVGQMIAFNTPANTPAIERLGSRIAHRVIAIKGEGGKLMLTTKGDNGDVDAFPVSADEVIGLVVGNLGPVGKPLLYLPNRRLLLTVGLPLLAFVLIFLATRSAAGEGPEQSGSTSSGLIRREFAGVRGALDGLTKAVAEYGVHLRSHTAAVRNLASATDELRKVAREQHATSVELQRAVRRHNELPGEPSSAIGKARSARVAEPTSLKGGRSRARAGASGRTARAPYERAA